MATEPDEADRLLRQTETLHDGDGNNEADENRARSIVSNDDEEQRRAVPMFAGQAKSVLAFFCYSWAIEVRCGTPEVSLHRLTFCTREQVYAIISLSLFLRQ